MVRRRSARCRTIPSPRPTTAPGFRRGPGGPGRRHRVRRSSRWPAATAPTPAKWPAGHGHAGARPGHPGTSWRPRSWPGRTIPPIRPSRKTSRTRTNPAHGSTRAGSTPHRPWPATPRPPVRGSTTSPPRRRALRPRAPHPTAPVCLRAPRPTPRGPRRRTRRPGPRRRLPAVRRSIPPNPAHPGRGGSPGPGSGRRGGPPGAGPAPNRPCRCRR